MERYKVSFEKRVYNKDTFNEVVDRSFQEFGQRPTESIKTVDQFFRDYEELYYQIPATGSTNSHQYLVEKSSLLYKVEQDFIDIQPLLDEITTLKNQVIADQQTIADLRIQMASGSVK